MSETTIASFVLRFTREHDAGDPPSGSGWRGVIRHVQIGQEIHFTRMEDALAFLARYVDIDSDDGRMTSDEID